MPEEEFNRKLTPAQYHICREKGTEPPFSGKYVSLKQDGMYHCVACGNSLFSSDTKFDSGTGWPSFWDMADKKSVLLQEDTSDMMRRTEVVCGQCGSHLGHVFEDGPKDKTGLRYCINSLALNFQAKRSRK